MSDQHGLAVFLDHLEVIRRVYTPLKEDPGSKRLSGTSPVIGLDGMYVLAAYLKNSVTSFVEPLRVMAWRVGAGFCLCFAAGGILGVRRVDERERRVDGASARVGHEQFVSRPREDTQRVAFVRASIRSPPG